MLNDLRYALRMLRKHPGFTFVAVLTLALGIGANTAIFTLINTLLFKPVMAKDPRGLAGVYQHETRRGYQLFSYPDFVDLRGGKEVFSDLAAGEMAPLGWPDGGLTMRIPAVFVSANYFSLFGVSPVLGRGFLPEEEASATPVAVLSHGFWQRLGADPGIVGRTIKLTRGDVTVVGVMPRGFTGDKLLPPELYLTLGLDEAWQPRSGQNAGRILSDRTDHRFSLVGRLKPGLDLATVAGPLAVLSERYSLADPKDGGARTLVCAPPDRFDAHPTPSEFGREMAPVATLAQVLSVLILFIACLNLANMMLARNVARKKEIAVRLALGAGRRRVLRQLLTEGMLLAMLGGGAGLLLSSWAVSLLVPAFAEGIAREVYRFNSLGDWRLLAAATAFSGMATLFFALGPALKLARLDCNADLKRHEGEDAGTQGAGRWSGRNLLGAGQIAISLSMLVAAALFARSAAKALRANPGFEFGSNFYVALDDSLTSDSDLQARGLIRSATDRIKGLPGVESVSPAWFIPFGPARAARTVWRGGGRNLPDQKNLDATYNTVGADYFRTLGMPLLEGREFERREAETTNAPRVAIVNQRLAAQFWPGEDPLGRLIQLGQSDLPCRVIGVVGDVDWNILDHQRHPEIYEPLGQAAVSTWKLHVRVAPGVNPSPLMAAVGEELRRLDPRMPLTQISTLEAMHRNSPQMTLVRVGGELFGAFGAVAVLLSFLGVYGLKAYEVARRTREIGIRMALGANPGAVVALILRESARLAVPGLGLGLALSLGLGWFSSRFLYQVPPFDPLILFTVPPLLLAVVLAACWLPARRAARVDPMTALRME